MILLASIYYMKDQEKENGEMIISILDMETVKIVNFKNIAENERIIRKLDN